MESPPLTKNFFKTACYFESALILVAIVLGWIAEINPFEYFIFSESAIGLGIIGTLPLFLLFLALEKISFQPLQEIRKLLLDNLCANLYKHHWIDLLILASIAGVAEEVLFRGVVQLWLERAWGASAGLIATSLIFGLVHAVTPLYVLLAMLISIYLGLSLDYGGSRNLLTPVIIHGLYDFLVFIALMKAYKLRLLKG